MHLPTRLLPALILPSLLLVACHPGGEAGLDADAAPNTGPAALPTADTGLERGRLGDLVEAEPCSAALATSEDTGALPEDGAGVLVVDHCLRLSPEEEEHEHEDEHLDPGGDDTDPGSTDGLEPALPPPPCTFSNLIGSLAVVGDPADPLVVYCDSDDDGGLRLVRVEGPQELRTKLLQPQACIADIDSVALTAVGAGYELFYVQPSSVNDPVVQGAVMDSQGWGLDEPTPLDLDRVPQQLARVGLPDADLLLVRAQDESLTVQRLDAEGGAPAELAELAAAEVIRFDAVAVGDQAVVAACTDGGALLGWRLDAEGQVLAEASLSDQCDSFSRPSLATDGQTLLLGVSTSAGGGWLRVLDEDLQVRSESFLGTGAQLPAVGWDGLRFVSIDASGQVISWSAELEQLQAWVHPMVAGAAGQVDGFRLALDDETWTIATMGMEYGPGVSEGHIHTFEWVELSSSPAPARRAQKP